MGGQLPRPHKCWNPLVSLPFLLPWISTTSLISRTSYRQPIPVWITLTAGSCHPPGKAAAQHFFLPPQPWLITFPFLVVAILSIFPRVCHLLEYQSTSSHVTPRTFIRICSFCQLPVSYCYLPSCFPITSSDSQHLLSVLSPSSVLSLLT